MRILIIANGDKPPLSLFQILLDKSDYFIAADGGGNTAIEFGHPPDVVIGDLDSFRYMARDNFEVIHDEDQETNDLEKALHLAVARNACRVDVLGATGKRLDHTLKNLSVMQQFHSTFGYLAFYDENLFLRILPMDFSVSLPLGHLVSLFPLSGKVEGIITEGLKFPLYNESLENGRRDGSSNQTASEEIRIRHRSGTLLFITGITDHLIL